MNKIIVCILIALSLCTLTVNAQVMEAKDSNHVKPYEPISAMLDSMAAQTFLNRATFMDAARNLPYRDNSQYEFKSYPDSVYRKNLAKLQSPIPLDYNDQVKQWIELYAKKTYLMQRVLGLSNLYFPMFEEILDREGLPLEFKYLSIVESALNPLAVSRCGATGLWQFMYTTGILYDLKTTSYTDDRKDPYKATVAACQYFKDMYLIYKDWLLVIAAYNCGAGNVNRAILRAGGSHDFWEISRYLPSETRAYVPAFIAVNYMMNYAYEYGLTPDPPTCNYFQVDTVTVTKPVTLNQVAKNLDVPLDILQYLNPIYKKGYIPAIDNTCKLRLPFNKVNAFLANSDAIYKASYQETVSTYTQNQALHPNATYETVTKDAEKTYTVQRGESLPLIAGRFGVSTADLTKWNHLRGSTIYPGQKLTIVTKEVVKVEKQIVSKDTTKAIAVKDSNVKANDTVALVKTDSATVVKTAATTDIKDTPSVKYIYHTIVPGDTLWNIAQRYQGVTIQKLKEINKLPDNCILTPGTKLKVQVGG